MQRFSFIAVVLCTPCIASLSLAQEAAPRRDAAALRRALSTPGPRAESSAARTQPSSALASGSSSAQPAPTNSGAYAPVVSCPPAIRDAATNNCMSASSIPTLGSLYPMSPSLNVDAAGNVGINTTSQSSALEVAGDVQGTERVAFGNLASIGLNAPNGWFGPQWDSVADISGRLTDFSSSPLWTALRSWFVVDPSIDLTGPNSVELYSHDFEVWTDPASTKNLDVIYGPWLMSWHLGSGTVDYLLGGAMGARTIGVGHTHQETGALVFATPSESATLDYNTGLEVVTGHLGVGSGSIQNNYSIHVGTPDTVSPIARNYGLYIDDQNVATIRNYAIYCAGGKSYFAGNVGIGTQPTNYALQVGNPGDGSEARANSWNVLSSCEYKTDVEALDDAAYEDVLAQIEATDVVHYRYLDDDRRHIGVIAEESPQEILGRDKKSVSLGDYNAFLLAGLKAQQNEIRELRAALDELQATVARQQ